jgi:Zn-dependent protease
VPELTPDTIARWLTGYVVLLFSVSVHESAHGWMALRMGDDTAYRQGRVSLNPLVHIDPIGTVLMPLLQLFASGIPFLAWAKPTPVGAQNFRNLARGHVLVAGAGPASNLILATIFTFLMFVAVRAGIASQGTPVFAILSTGVMLNLGLFVFNLVPLPPLDGSWIASWGLPRSLGSQYDRIVAPYGQWILLILVMSGGIGWVLGPVLNVLAVLVARLVF